jgi:hypothetical protein
MKYLKNCLTLFSILLHALLIFGTASGVVAQEDVYVEVARFSILIETSGDEIKLTCSDGCAWRQLSFSSSIKSDPQAVDQYGMTTLTRDMIKQDSLNGDFLFTIKRTQEGVTLEGKAGTMWPSLTFDCAGGKCSRPIDGWGVSDLKKKG